MLGKIPAITVLRANTVGDDIMSERALNCGTIPLYEDAHKMAALIRLQTLNIL
jgi:hypothetical protein